jgi:hypothetical protein
MNQLKRFNLQEGKMNYIKDILDKYSNGHQEIKLNLFLECPELRSEFIQIDLAKRSIKASYPKQKKDKYADNKST